MAKHMDTLIHVDPVTAANNVRGLRRLYDLVESNVRRLASLGVEANSYGGPLASVLISKIPQELQLIVSRKLGNKDWDLDELMTTFGEKLQARERATAIHSTTAARKTSKDLPTAATLFSDTSNQLSCSYCQNNHPSNSCTIVSQPDACKQALQRAGRCFVCLCRGHVSRACRSNKRCSKCNGRHHISICAYETGNPPALSTTPADYGTPRTTNPAATPRVNPPKQTPPKQTPSTRSLDVKAPVFMSQDRTTNLWVNSDRAVLLQTAQAQVLNPDSPAHSRMVRIVFDSGSQRSYITQQVARELSLTPKGKQQLTVMTFSSNKAQSHECKLVELNVVLKNRQTRQLSLFAVPLICEPLSSQPVNLCQDIFDHIMDLDLADPVDGRSQSEVDILIGSDQYWDIATGKS